MRDVLEFVDRHAGTPVATGMVVGVKRSAPRPPGAKMAVAANGDVHGAVSGGCVEGSVVQAADEVLAGGPPRLLHFGIADEEAWDVGLPCGGEIDVWVAAHHGPAALGLAELVRAEGRGAVVTRMDDGRTLLVRADGARSGSLGDEALDAAAVAAAEELMWAERSEKREGPSGEPLFVDVTFPAPRLIVIGAIDFAAQLCTIARSCGWRPYVVDPRSRFATATRFPDAEEVIAAWPGDAFTHLGGIDRATSIAVLTHDPKLDDAALEVALRSDASYVGAMGSRRAQARRRERLLARGVTDAELDRLAAPIGLDVGALTPEETALSIMAEVVAVRRGRDGGRLRHAQGRIHEVGA
jgi:xanthine dehydrogenase accessory factor